MADKKIPENPLLKKLVAEGATNSITFRGYIGPATTAGNVNLYPNLDDLSESVEIAQGDILDYAELPESALPLGGVIVWVKKDATITRRTANTITKLSDTEPRADFREVGRLRMRIRRVLADTCQSRCSTCQSRCSTCQSRCSSRLI